MPRLLVGILLLGLGARIAFLLLGAAAFYHSPDHFYFNGDSGSYMQAFENLWHTGYYTFDFMEPDAAFGRLPGYPFFYGLHYLLFGTRAPMAVAWSQLLIDTAAIFLVFKIVERLALARPWTAYLGALLYATYPFIIVWGPIVGTEALSTDLTLLWLYVVLGWRPTVAYGLGLGLLLALCLFVREYMGILLPITLLWVLWNTRTEGVGRAVRHTALVAIGFGLLYSAWPIRNYILAHRLVLLKPRAAGYANQTPDVDEFYQWVHCWTSDENPWLDSMLVGKGPIRFPRAAFHTAAEEHEVQALVALARRCGSGFYVRRTGVANQAAYQDTAAMRADTTYQRYRHHNCNAAIGTGFQQVRQRFAAREPLRFWFDVPLRNLSKAFFKTSVAANQTQSSASASVRLVQLLFGYRTLLLLLGLAGLLVGLRRNAGLWLVLAVSGGLYGYICFFYRGLEMRYLLQADVLLLLPACLLLGRWLKLPWAVPAA